MTKWGSILRMLIDKLEAARRANQPLEISCELARDLKDALGDVITQNKWQRGVLDSLKIIQDRIEYLKSQPCRRRGVVEVLEEVQVQTQAMLARGEYSSRSRMQGDRETVWDNFLGKYVLKEEVQDVQCVDLPAVIPTTCTYDPQEMKGAPIGMFHCPECGEMVLAGVPHPGSLEES